jgi:glycosyltransferase involved in cell wall biosynthesis
VLTVLSIAYPLACTGPLAVGGAEQVLTMLDAALVAAGHRSIVIARKGSTAAGELVPVPAVAGPLDDAAIRAAQTSHRAAISHVLASTRVDLVHMHGVDFDAYLPRNDIPVLVTMHCPAGWYGPDTYNIERPKTYFNAVSASQYAALRGYRHVVGHIDNGVAVPSLNGPHAKRQFALMLCRVAPDKGIHLGLAAAHRAGVPLLVAGELFPYPDHQRYVAKAIAPLVDRYRRLIGPVHSARKRRMLTGARCLVICSQVHETSSLAAREALAVGTPVIALRRGALVDVVEHGRTGFLVDTEAEMAAALLRADEIDPDACRSAARERFDADGMIRGYLALYETLAQRHATGRPFNRDVA